MKRHVLTTFVFCGLLAFASPGWSLTINSGAIDVGFQDSLLYSALLPNSDNQTEIDWVNSMVGTSFTVQDKYDVIELNWTAVDSSPGIWALELKDDPAYILIKTGNVGVGMPRHYLFDNLDEFGWAVIGLSDLNIVSITNVGKISHVGEFGTTPVPEPTTLLLLGSGLVALCLVSRKFKR